MTAASSQTPSKSSSTTRWILTGIVILVVVVGLIVSYAFLLHPLQTITVVNTQITVSPGTSQRFSFSVPSGATNAHVHGSFSAAGGSGNDIIVHVKDSGGYDYYNSGQVTTSNFDVNLYAGSYTLVFDNTFSALTTKTVQAQATLNYNS